ncbi:CBL-interacting serine/threonine-protein kinase 1-like [Rutidosis leptorrhynchoides]|uniref:CBL-interacting serine/threonine-protein kinase 1-like n=1 Tax=Rutidosis leptorrhynchoides TaxID=125765 RepID=UPI003A9944D5
MVFVGRQIFQKLKKKETEKEEEEENEMQELLRLGGRYKIGRTLGYGNMGKIKYAKDIQTEHSFAIQIINNNLSDQIKRDISTLKLLKHPNVVRLHHIVYSKTKIYMVLEYVTGGELSNTIASNGKLPESDARKLFQQLIDGVSYCHDKGVFHRDLKLENVLVDAKGNIKISDFGLSALPQQFRDDGLLYENTSSPNLNYVAPEILSNRGYDGAALDTWSCGVILYVILTGYPPFDARNVVVLYQKIFNGEVHIPKWMSPGARCLIKRILDPNPKTRITMTDIKADEWFNLEYTPFKPNQEVDMHICEDQVLQQQDTLIDEKSSSHINV